MDETFAGIVLRFRRAAAGFERSLRIVRADQWAGPTPCAEWDVRQLVNHVVRGNLNYIGLLDGGSRDEFLRLRDTDALGDDPLGSHTGSVSRCAAAFSAPGALDRELDYPMGRIPGRQALAVRTADTIVHTWDLARAVGGDDTLDPDLVIWISSGLADIYAGLDEMPTSARTSHRFFAAPAAAAGPETRQHSLLRLLGRNPAWHH